MKFWKASVDKTNSVKSKTLSSITLRASGDRLIVRMNMDDDTFFDTYCDRIPIFKNGDVLHLDLVDKVEVPYRNDGQEEENG